MRNFFPALIAIASLVLSSCGAESRHPLSLGENQDDNPSGSYELSDNACADFSADSVYSATGIPVVKIQADTGKGSSSCRYYSNYAPDQTENEFLTIEYGNSSILQLADEARSAGGSVRTDDMIRMDHIIVMREDGAVREVALKIGPNRLLSISQTGQMASAEVVLAAGKLAEQVQGRLSYEIKSNPGIPAQASPEIKN